MKKHLLIPIVFALVLVAFRPPASHVLKGTVTDAVTLKPIKGALVIVYQQNDSIFTDAAGQFSVFLKHEKSELRISHHDFADQKLMIADEKFVSIALRPHQMNTIMPLDAEVEMKEEVLPAGYPKKHHAVRAGLAMTMGMADQMHQPYNTENYATIHENGFLASRINPLSTFSIDVDAASYSNIRRFINNGQNPPKDAVRIEEMVNYFEYEYAPPTDEHPFAIHTELSYAPWNQNHKLLKIGLQGMEIPKEDLPWDWYFSCKK